MQNKEFYDIAISYAEKIKEKKPYYFTDSDNSFCIILTDTQELYTGITSVKITDAGVEIVPAEFNATMSMIYDSKAKALQLVVISLTDYKVKIPVDECLDFLTRIESSNKECEIVTSLESSITIEDLKTAFAPMDDAIFKITPDNTDPMPMNNDMPGSGIGAPADFAAGFDFDESNPFFAGEGSEDANTPPPVQAISAKPVNPYENLSGANQMGGFQQPYHQQMGGFQQPYQRQMGGFQQPYQQQMGGYQQPYQQQMGGYQQPYQQQMGGYQQPYQQQMGGYSQPMGYSQPYQSANASAYSQQSVQYSAKNTDTNNEDNQGNMMKNRLSNLLGGGGSNPEESAAKPVEPTISREELLKRSKEMKKAVKLNEKMKKQF